METNKKSKYILIYQYRWCKVERKKSYYVFYDDILNIIFVVHLKASLLQF